MTTKLSGMALGAALVLGACATPYGEMGLLGGTEVEEVGPATLVVRATGNGFTSHETVDDFAFLRAAEETESRGYAAFQLVEGRDISKEEVVHIRGLSREQTRVNRFGYRETVTTYDPGTNVVSTEPGSEIVVRLLPGPVQDPVPSDVFVAADVIRFLGPKVR
jgi:hypothetical protein